MTTTKRQCALSHVSLCEGGISAEHYISKAALELVAMDGKVPVLGLPWLKAGPRHIGINSLVANCLCRKHNSLLSHLDTVGARLLRCLQDAQRWLKSGATKSKTNTFDGLKIERWLLKSVYMMWASGNLPYNGSPRGGMPPELWATLLIGEQNFPLPWGLYVPISEPFGTEPRQIDLRLGGGDELMMAELRLAAVPFKIVMGSPPASIPQGVRRPGAIILQGATSMHTLRLTWPEPHGAQVVFKLVPFEH